jgi:putative peptidoglycan lipid II flippase
LRGEVARTLRSTAFIFAPLTVWMVMNALPITRLLYEHGHFSFADSQLIARVLAIYSLGVLPNALTFVFLRSCYALQDTWTPLWAESANLALYLAAAPFLAHNYGIAGLAAARAISFLFVAVIFVGVLTARKGVLRITWNGIGYFLRLAVASGAVWIILWATLERLPVTTEGVRFTFHLTVLSLTAVSGLVVFFAAAFLLRLPEAPLFLHSARDLWQRFRT